MGAFIDLTGNRYGRLLVIERAENRYSGKDKIPTVYWICLCDCGTIADYNACSMRQGLVKSCGCLRKELSSKRCNLGYTHTKEYKAYHSMRKRCNNANNKDFHNYGGRGIKVCDHWEKSY